MKISLLAFLLVMIFSACRPASKTAPIMSDTYMSPADIKARAARIWSYPATIVYPDAKFASLMSANIKLEPITLPTGLPDKSSAPETTEIQMEGIRLPSLKPDELVGRSFSLTDLTRDIRYEGSVYLQGEHHWVVLRRISFGERTKTGIIAKFELEFDLYFCKPDRFTKTIAVDTQLETRRPE